MKLVSIVTLVLVALVLAAPAAADHPHWIATPAGCKEDVAKGQTRKSEDEPGGHKFHDNVHTGTPGTHAFANERNPVSVGRDSCP
jgi:hypothetical protein